MLDELGGDPDRAVEALGAYRDAYPDLARDHTTVVAGMRQVLTSLTPSKELRVVTSKPAAFAVPILEAMDLADHFAEVHAPALDELEQPKSDTLAQALDVAGMPAEHTAMVGDHPADVRAGRVNGTATVGVTWGTASRAELEDAGADVVVDEPAELLKLF